MIICDCQCSQKFRYKINYTLNKGVTLIECYKQGPLVICIKIKLKVLDQRAKLVQQTKEKLGRKEIQD